MQQLTKDVAINGAKFQLSKMSAQLGSWMQNVLVAGAMKATSSAEPTEADLAEIEKLTPEQKAVGTVITIWLNAASILTEEQYGKIQQHCLRLCSKYESEIPIPIVTIDGRWACKELEHDGPTVNELVTEVLKFNLTPFFLGRALSANPTNT